MWQTRGNDDIRIFHPDGRNIANIDATGQSGSSSPIAVATNSTGHIFVSFANVGAAADSIEIYTDSGVYIEDLPLRNVDFGRASGIAVNPDDRLIIVDSQNNEVYVFGHQIIYSDTGLQQFASAADTSGNFGILRPTVSVTSDVLPGATTALDTVGFTVVFSEEVTGFDALDIAVTGMAQAAVVPSSFDGAANPTFTFDVQATDDGEMTVSVLPLAAQCD